MRREGGRGRIPNDDIADLVDRLTSNAEAVCRRYLSRGRREGTYWRVGDLANTPGRSLFVRLRSGARGRAGKWTDAATGEHGDLLDIIRATCGLRSFTDTIAEARAFLGMPTVVRNMTAASAGRRRPARMSPRALSRPAGDDGFSEASPATSLTAVDSINAARRLVMASTSIDRTLAETYLRRRGITSLDGLAALRFHPACLYRDEADQVRDVGNDPSLLEELPSSFRSAWRGPALITSLTDAEGWITGVQRTWLDAGALRSDAPLDARLGKVDLPDPRRSLGLIAGSVVRFAALRARHGMEALLVGEGLETVLSLRAVLPTVPMAATLSAGLLAAFDYPEGLQHLLIAQDNDPAGLAAAASLVARAAEADLATVVLTPRYGDFNDDLRGDGLTGLMTHVRSQLDHHGLGELCQSPP